jgi:streptomycin 6-kinase
LTDRLNRAVQEWRLELDDVLEGGWNSLVVSALMDQSPVVLKLPPRPEAVAVEAAALRWWGEGIAPRVYGEDLESGALLLERLEPGTELSWAGVEDTARIVPLFRAMHRPVPGGHELPIPSLADAGVEALATFARNLETKRALVDGAVADQAEALLASLFATRSAGEPSVLHGDAVPANVLRASSSWRVIDPRSAVGDRAYDVAYWSIFSGYGSEAQPNVALLAGDLELDEHRVLSWAWGLAVSRLLHIVDSTFPLHARLVEQLRAFISRTGHAIDA